MSENRDAGTGGALIAIGAVGLAVLCCAGPVLIAAGGLGLAGGLLGSWPVLGVAGLIVAAAVGYTLVRVRRRTGAGSTVAGSAVREGSGEQAPPVMVDDCCAVPPKRAVARPDTEQVPLGDRTGRA
jgi:hypothetical protein